MNVTSCSLSTSNSLWDLQALIDTIGYDTDLINTLTSLFVDDSRQRINLLERALSEGDLDVVRKEAHTLKGSASNIRAPRAREAAARLEITARQGNCLDCRQRLRELKEELADLYEGFKTILCQLAA